MSVSGFPILLKAEASEGENCAGLRKLLFSSESYLKLFGESQLASSFSESPEKNIKTGIKQMIRNK